MEVVETGKIYQNVLKETSLDSVNYQSLVQESIGVRHTIIFIREFKVDTMALKMMDNASSIKVKDVNRV